MNKKFFVEYRMNIGKKFSAGGILRLIKYHALRYLFWGRITEQTNSIVVGNPGIIKSKENPVVDYIKEA